MQKEYPTSVTGVLKQNILTPEPLLAQICSEIAIIRDYVRCAENAKSRLGANSYGENPCLDTCPPPGLYAVLHDLREISARMKSLSSDLDLLA